VKKEAGRREIMDGREHRLLLPTFGLVSSGPHLPLCGAPGDSLNNILYLLEFVGRIALIAFQI
jgi:hypothetical protein